MSNSRYDGIQESGKHSIDGLVNSKNQLAIKFSMLSVVQFADQIFVNFSNIVTEIVGRDLIKRKPQIPKCNPLHNRKIPTPNCPDLSNMKKVEQNEYQTMG